MTTIRAPGGYIFTFPNADDSIKGLVVCTYILLDLSFQKPLSPRPHPYRASPTAATAEEPTLFEPPIFFLPPRGEHLPT